MDVMIGTWAWGSGYNGSGMIFGSKSDEQTLKCTFDKAVELGFTKWDTAAVYGMGSCEKLLGGFINGRTDIFLPPSSSQTRNTTTGISGSLLTRA